jgi:hypothetical protein
MAADGDRQPDLGVVGAGASRAPIVAELGPPSTVENRPGGSVACTHEYTIGDKPSYGRALGHAVANAITIGLRKIIGTPIEMNAGGAYRTAIVYDTSGQAQTINGTRLE